MNWDMVKLGDLCEILDTLRKPITKKFRKAGKYPYYGATGIVDWVDDYIFEEELVLVGEDGAKWDAGEKTAFIVDGKYWVNNHAHVIKPNKDKLLKKWLTYYLCGIDLTPWITGLTVPKLNQAQLKSIPIPLPPIPEQQRILAKLDIAFTEIDKQIKLNVKNQIELSKKLFTKYLNSTFQNSKHKTIKIGDILGVKSGGTPSTTNKNYWNGSIPWYSSRELNDYRTKDSIKKITELALKNSNAKIFPKNTLLIGIYDTAAMKMSILHQEGTFNQAIVGIPPNSKFDTEYLFFVLNYLKDKILLERRGVRQMNLSLAKIKNINVPMPTLEEQEKTINKCNKFKEQNKDLEKILLKKLNLLKLLKKSILTKELNNKIA